MQPIRIPGHRRPLLFGAVYLLFIISLLVCGCNRVAGNYPLSEVRHNRVSARLNGDGFELLAGSRLPLDQVEAELGQLKSQGFSPRDPQIIRSVARRKNVPVALLDDRSGNTYYRFTANLEPGTDLTLAPGDLEITIITGGVTSVLRDHGYLLVDRRIPAGCRPPSHSTLVLGSPEQKTVEAVDFLVRLPVKGEIVALDLLLPRSEIVRKEPLSQ